MAVKVDLAIDLTESPPLWAARTGDGLVAGQGDEQMPRGRAVLLLPLTACAVLRVPHMNVKPHQVEAALRIQLAKALKCGADSVVLDWTTTGTAIVAAGTSSRQVTETMASYEGKGIRVEAIEPAAMALLRAVLGTDETVVLIVNASEGNAELVAGTGQDLLLVRRTVWAQGVPASLALEVAETLRSLRQEAGAPPVESVRVCGVANLEPIVQALRDQVDISVEIASLHPTWGIEDPGPRYLTAAGGLLEAPERKAVMGRTGTGRTRAPALPPFLQKFTRAVRLR
jgi:hypothetical protein